MKDFTIKMIIVGLCTGCLLSCSDDDSSLVDGLPDAVVNNDPPGSPPRGLTETWGDHTESVSRQSFDASATVFYDPEVDREILWPINFSSSFWNQVINSYGVFGGDSRLYFIGHGEESDAFIKNSFDESTNNRTILDASVLTAELSAEKMDALVKLLSELVETSVKKVNGSPASAVWQDKWSEIFTYDLYTKVELDADAARVKSLFTESSVDYPSPDSFWFRDWFLPLYENYNGSGIFNNFFNILSTNYPIDGTDYAKEMNIGEFVHFFSGASGDDLQPMFETAFGWNDDWAQELLIAQAQFPNLNYPFDPASTIIDLTSEATITVSRDNDNGPNAGEGSLKLIDNDLSTKFLAPGFPQEFWMQQNFAQSTVANKYTITSGNDAPDRDLKSWKLLGSNDEVNWDTLDQRTDQVFTDRNFTREFDFDNNQGYRYYRIEVLANNGSTLIQASEWRMLRLELLDFGPTDFTLNATIEVSRENSGGADGAEGSKKAIDNDVNTKFLVGGFPDTMYMQQNFEAAVTVNEYRITSANDAHERDPLSWTLSGSNDGSTWVELDSRSNEDFPDFFQERTFLVDNDQAYLHYRLDITENNGSDAMQLAEWRLYGN